MKKNDDMRSGMTNRSPPAVDASMKPPKGSVNDSPTRKSVGMGGNDAGPGPRDA